MGINRPEEAMENECFQCKLRWRCPNDDVEVWYCPYFQPEDQSNTLLY